MGGGTCFFGDLYSDLYKSGGVSACPDEVVEVVEDKVAEHLERLGKAFGKGVLSTARTVQATLNVLTNSRVSTCRSHARKLTKCHRDRESLSTILMKIGARLFLR